MLASIDFVTSVADDGSPGTLRSVMAAAAPGDTIMFNVTGTITLVEGQLEISKILIISGPGATNLSVSGADTFTVFQVDSGVAAVIFGITIEHGYASRTGGGGGIDNQGALGLINSTVSDNFFQDDGAVGEGIYNIGFLTLFNSTVSTNFSSAQGAGIYNTGTLELIGSTVSGNAVGLPGAGGGGIYNSGGGKVKLVNSTVSGNEVHDGAQGAGIFNSSTLKLRHSTVADNINAFGPGSGIYNSGTLTALKTTFSGNTDFEDNGGGLSNTGTATVTDSTFSGNSTTDGGWGGAIYNEGTLTVVNSTLAGCGKIDL